MYSPPVGRDSTSAPDVSVSAEENLPLPSDIEPAAVHSAGISSDEVNRAEVPQTESTVRYVALYIYLHKHILKSS